MSPDDSVYVYPAIGGHAERSRLRNGAYDEGRSLVHLIAGNRHPGIRLCNDTVTIRNRRKRFRGVLDARCGMRIRRGNS